MPSQNDFSITSSNTNRGNELVSTFTGNSVTSFQAAALCTIESIIRNSGSASQPEFSNYKLGGIIGVPPGPPSAPIENGRIFYDADNDPANGGGGLQTDQPSVALLTAFLKQDGTYDNGMGSGAPTGGDPLDLLIDKIAPKLFSLFSKASEPLSTTSADTDDCLEEGGSGRYQSQCDECIYKVCVSVY